MSNIGPSEDSIIELIRYLAGLYEDERREWVENLRGDDRTTYAFAITRAVNRGLRRGFAARGHPFAGMVDPPEIDADGEIGMDAARKCVEKMTPKERTQAAFYFVREAQLLSSVGDLEKLEESIELAFATARTVGQDAIDATAEAIRKEFNLGSRAK